jgi:hypothetical protein
LSYLKEILNGDYSNYNEDRLSQIFSASFNHSHLFKKTFFTAISFKPASISDYIANTQINYSTQRKDARIDIIIYRRNKPAIIIENKVDAALTVNQLKKYDNIKDISTCKKIVIAKHFFENFSDIKKWKIHHWSDLYAKFNEKLNTENLNPIDKFIFTNFIEHLELLNMTRVYKISESELAHFSDTIYKIRNRPKPIIALSNKNIFDTGTQILSMLEEIIELAHKEPLLVESVGKNFRYRPFIDWWYLNEVNEHNNLSITVHLFLSNSPNKINRLGTGFFFNNKTKKFSVSTYAQLKGDGEFIKEVEYKRKGKGIVFDDYAKQVISHWKKWLRSHPR